VAKQLQSEMRIVFVFFTIVKSQKGLLCLAN